MVSEIDWRPIYLGFRVHRHIRSLDDVLTLLDGLFVPDADRWTERAGDWRDRFYADREREAPFFVAKPDENLASYREQGLDVRFRHGDAFATTGTYDLIYDSGCFHQSRTSPRSSCAG